MPVNLADYGNLIESISDMTFRNEAHIKISKAKREIAYTQTLDIVVESIDFSQYENFKSAPPIQFYGYVELVFQDALSLEIPIHFPRQRLYQAYQWEALKQWSDYVPFLASREYHANTIAQLEAIKAALEIPETVTIEAQLWDTKWTELPLREIHVRLQKNAQFVLSYAQYQPVPFDDPLSPIPKKRDGKSHQSDGDKDNGLPSGGIQPGRRDVFDSFGGNRLPSSESDLAGFGFSPLLSGNLTSVDPRNEPAPPDPEGTLYWVKVTSRTKRSAYPQGCQNERLDISYILALKDSQVVSIVPNQFSNPHPCFPGETAYAWNLTLTGGEPFNIGFSDQTPIVEKGQGLVKPSDTSSFVL